MRRVYDAMQAKASTNNLCSLAAMCEGSIFNNNTPTGSWKVPGVIEYLQRALKDVLNISLRVFFSSSSFACPSPPPSCVFLSLCWFLLFQIQLYIVPYCSCVLQAHNAIFSSTSECGYRKIFRRGCCGDADSIAARVQAILKAERLQTQF